MMELDTRMSEPASNVMPSITIVPQKRKAPPAEGDFPPGTFSNEDDHIDSASAIDPGIPKGEYESGHVTCETCGEGISFRDEATGVFTVKHWDKHRMTCPNANQPVAESALYTPDAPADSPTQPQTKRRRAKRTEEERIEYLRSDPYVAQFEAYRVLCASCDKWIRLRPNSTYCSIPWDAHRKSCLAKRVAKNSHLGEDRSSIFADDPNVRKFDSERVQCKACEDWVGLGASDNAAAHRLWLQHRAVCSQHASASSATPGPSNPSPKIPTIDSVPPPSKHLMALVSSSALPIAPTATVGRTATPKTAPPTASPSTSRTTFKDFVPLSFPPSQESRRKNAEQRAAALRSDPLIGEVEPNRVFCSLCQKWVQLRQDSSFCAYPWLQHRGKCLNRQITSQKQIQDRVHPRSLQSPGQFEEQSKSEDGADSDEPESEEGVESGETEEKERRRAARREEKRRAKDAARLARQRIEDERRVALLSKALPPALALALGDEDAEGEPDLMEIELGHPARLADLDTPAGRFDFTFKSVRYLFRTSYERSDDLTIATLVTYLNAAMPPDKHEDFDTTEVTKAAIALHTRGDFVFEGDVLRLPE